MSAVEEVVNELAAAAVKKLRRLRMCPEGRDEMITHLIVGSHKRTLKVLPAQEGTSRIRRNQVFGTSNRQNMHTRQEHEEH